MNKFMSCALGGALVLSAAGMAHSETMTAKVRTWNPAAKQLVLEDRQILQLDPGKATVPGALSAGDTVTIHFTSDDNGYTSILAVILDQDQ